MRTPPTPWTRDAPTTSPFALPRGLSGWLAGRLMLRLNRQQDLVDLLDIREGHSVLEVGYGPGGLIRLLRATPAARVCGVDPSPQMHRLATRHVAHPDRIDLRLGTAAATGFDEEFDRVVSVNNVAIWPDLAAGLTEMHRVTRPGGRLLLAWHGGSNPSRIARGNALTPDQLDRVETGLADRFATVTRHELTGLTTWIAVR